MAGRDSAETSVTVGHLACEAAASPLGIDARTPRLSWRLDADERGVSQTAYQIVVSSDPALLPVGDLWDTGRKEGAESVLVPYAGPPLESRRRYHWAVRVWDEHGRVSPWSDPAWWEMGLLEPADWTARWISSTQPPIPSDRAFLDALEPSDDMVPKRLAKAQAALVADGIPPVDHSLLQAPPLLRGTFLLPEGTIRSARAYATAHGVYRLSLNGDRVSDVELAPDWTSYPHCQMYQTYDIADRLRPGENVVGVTLADGWWAGHLGLTGGNLNYGDSLEALVQVEVVLDDGTTIVACSDEGFTWSLGPIVYSDLLVGEKYDARLAQSGWDAPGFDDGGWRAVRSRAADPEALVAQCGEQVRILEVLPAVEVRVSPRGERIVDFGQVIAGRVRMRVRAAAGQTVTLSHCESLDAEGNYLDSVVGYNNENRDVYVAGGYPDEVYEPAFTYHGFRYVRVEGYPGDVEPADFTAVAMGSDLAQTGRFTSSDERLNRLAQNVRWTMRSNFFSVVTDNPDRERAGWTGDLQIILPTAARLMDVQGTMRRWMRSLRIDQQPDGQVPMVVPWFDGYGSGLTKVSSAGWADACVIVPWTVYEQYGDESILAENYDAMRRWVAFVTASAAASTPEEHRHDPDLLSVWWPTEFHFGDWLTPSATTITQAGLYGIESGYNTLHLVTTMYFARSADLLSRIAGVLGKEEDARELQELSERIRRGFAKAFLQPDGRLAVDLQGMYVLALAFDMVPEESRPDLVARLATLIDLNGDRLDTGFSSTAFILPVLSENDHAALAYTLLLQDRHPSWMYQVDRGATSVWELWNSIQEDGTPTRTSFIQPGFGTVGEWLFSGIAGIAALEPGYKRIRIAPVVDRRLQSASATLESPYGPIDVAWHLDGQLVLDVAIPPNTTAVVALVGAEHADSADVEIGSGSYRFVFPAPASIEEAAC